MDDRARIHIRAGSGGDGCASFRREAHVPRGGPDGGDGGRGGDVVLLCDQSLRDLHAYRRKTHYRAGRGGHGEGSLRHGADGETLVIRVPPGTEAWGADPLPREASSDLQGRRWELLAAGQRARIARGGSGGRGNKRFATPTRQAPRFAERGLPGEEGWIELQLRLLADVGLVGLPNAGKSSLLARLTHANPKVASYPFTTLSPVLGVLEEQSGGRQLVIADIPGLIEGASEGAGLGHDFLAHVERTRLLVHVLDIAPELSGAPDADSLANHAAIEHELAAHDPRLARLPRVLALAKADLLPADRSEDLAAEWQRRLGSDVPVILTSSATGLGLTELAGLLLRAVPEEADAGAQGRGDVLEMDAPRARTRARAGSANGEPPPAPMSAAGEEHTETELAEHMVFRPAGTGRGYTVRRTGERSFAVVGRGIERLIGRFDIDNEDALAYLEERLRRIGVLAALRDEGFQPGDDLLIAGVPFELDPELY
ncbi:MAG TPA: GTPase ObgE [Solirubrobacteraceae bacterium]|nr:GTPase ObgE [Solirubrobacteraceae bacterium]